MDVKCFLIIAIILGVLILIVLAVMMIYSIIIKEEFYKLKYCSTVVYMVPRA